jgi:septal ring factor EnvC (AmiA/AmiB activator)
MQWWGWVIVVVTAMGAALVGLVYSCKLNDAINREQDLEIELSETRQDAERLDRTITNLRSELTDSQRKRATASANFDASDRELAAAKQELAKAAQELAAMTAQRDKALEKAKAVDYWKGQAEDARLQVQKLTPTGHDMPVVAPPSESEVEPKKARAKSA